VKTKIFSLLLLSVIQYVAANLNFINPPSNITMHTLRIRDPYAITNIVWEWGTNRVSIRPQMVAGKLVIDGLDERRPETIFGPTIYANYTLWYPPAWGYYVSIVLDTNISFYANGTNSVIVRTNRVVSLLHGKSRDPIIMPLEVLGQKEIPLLP
jgi:hypothetical protein